MKSKAEIIRAHLAGLKVLDLGGSGYGEANPYEMELQNSWQVASRRTTLDYSDKADITLDLNKLPLPILAGEWDITTAFDVLEHLEHPVDILRWIPTNRLIVILPNAVSILARRMEEQGRSKHLFSFTPYTASILLTEGGWRIRKQEYQFGKWSLLSKIINLMGSLYPRAIATGMVFHCERTNSPTKAWTLR